MFKVKLKNANSNTKTAYIGPRISDGFKTENTKEAYLFNDEAEAELFANHFKNKWRGFNGFSQQDIVVVTVCLDAGGVL